MEMHSPNRCPTCGKTPVSLRHGDSEFVIGSCECAKKPEPTMADLIAELKACRAEIAELRHRLFPGLTRFAGLHTGEAVIPAALNPFGQPK